MSAALIGKSIIYFGGYDGKYYNDLHYLDTIYSNLMLY
jgi:hypothetical protein